VGNGKEVHAFLADTAYIRLQGDLGRGMRQHDIAPGIADDVFGRAVEGGLRQGLVVYPVALP